MDNVPKRRKAREAWSTVKDEPARPLPHARAGWAAALRDWSRNFKLLALRSPLLWWVDLRGDPLDYEGVFLAEST